MKSNQQVYIAIDLKSFYASVECVDRGLDPLGVNLVVADVSRTDKGICLAVTPAMKSHGLGGQVQLKLGFMHENGYGVEQNYQKAKECYEKLNKESEYINMYGICSICRQRIMAINGCI
ncbi:MAG: hypothetical protein MJ196_08340 [Treponemataceae bacterium]|nr:hypothetical protein [Treponemataceae bacterium]